MIHEHSEIGTMIRRGSIHRRPFIALLWITVTIIAFLSGYHFGRAPDDKILSCNTEAEQNEAEKIETAFLAIMNWDRDEFRRFVRNRMRANKQPKKNLREETKERPPPSFAEQFKEFQRKRQ